MYVLFKSNMFLLCLLLSAAPLFSASPAAARKGIIDLEAFDPAGGDLVPLDGEWEYVSQKLYSPEQMRTSSPDSFIILPRELAGYSGTATLRLRILLPGGGSPDPRSYGIKIPYFGAASKVWLNGQLSAETGSFSPFRPRYIPRELFFSTASSEAEIVIQVANYHHRRMRLNRIFFGSAEAVQSVTHKEVIKDSIFTGSLLLLSLFHFLLYLSYHHDRAFLHFSLIAFITALREGILNERILVRLMPGIPGELMMKMGYLPVFLLLPLLVLYIWQIARKNIPEAPRTAARLLIAASLILIVFFPLRVYDWVFQFSLVPISVLGVYSLYLIFSRQMFETRTGTLLLILGGACVLATAVNDYLREISVLHTPELLSPGILLFLLMQAFFLSWRLERSRAETERLSGEVRGMNEKLEARIRERTSELEMVNRRLEKLSRIDPLTEIPNRRYFEEVFLGEWRRSGREELPLSLIMIDVDFFKAYNDNYGHPAGDECLKRLADAIQNNLKRGEDFIARFGGEEFIVLLPGHPLPSACAVAEKIRAQVEGLGIVHAYSEAAPVVTISLGVAEKPQDVPIERKDLIMLADQALYEAKRGGRNRIAANAGPAR